MTICYKQTRGFTLTETAIMLGVAGLVFAGIWKAGSTVWQNNQIDKALQQVITVAQNMRDYYGPLGAVLNAAGGKACPGAGVVEITNVLDDASRRIFPVEMMESASANNRPINHAAASATTGSFHAYCVSDSQAFRLELTTLKKDVCSKMLLALPLLDPGMRMTRLQVNASSTAINTSSISNPGVSFALPLTVTSSIALCNNNTNNVILLDFQL